MKVTSKVKLMHASASLVFLLAYIFYRKMLKCFLTTGYKNLRHGEIRAIHPKKQMQGEKNDLQEGLEEQL